MLLREYDYEQNLLTFEQLKESFIQHYIKSIYRDAAWNNRSFEPFHLLNQDYNKSNIMFITDEIMDHIFPKPQCYNCIGPGFKLHPDENLDLLRYGIIMDCNESSYCKMNFRFDKKTKRRFVETKQDASDPQMIYMGRHLIVTNYFYQFPVIVRTAYWTTAKCHHIDGNGFNDNIGNHCLVDGSIHSGAHSRRKGACEQYVLLKNQPVKLREDGTPEPEEQKIRQLEFLEKEIQICTNQLINSKPLFEMIDYMAKYYDDLMKEVTERIQTIDGSTS